MTLAVRPDLSARTVLSKSALVASDLCGQKAWFELHDRRPLIPAEQITFGSAVDAGVEQILIALRAGVPVAQARPLDAAEEIIARDRTEVDIAEVDRACSAFVREVSPHFDWKLCGLQEHLLEDIPGIGEVDGHPDIRLADGTVLDVKTSKRSKPADAIASSVELGVYGLLSETQSGTPTPKVGYLTWVRITRPSWQILVEPFTDEMRRRTRARAAAYMRAKSADELLNRGAATPLNFTFPSGPRNDSLCGTCQYNPAFGGPCQLAVQGESDAA